MTTNTVRAVVGLIANVSVITALLVYFGWRQTETVAWQLGFDETILSMSTRDYVIRSVRPVLVLLICVAVLGLVWLWLERPLGTWLRGDPRRRSVRVTRLSLLLAWVILPLIIVGIGYGWDEVAYVALPASIAVGALLALYASRSFLGRGESGFRQSAELGLVGLVVAVCLFWTASRYAEVNGISIAQGFISGLERVTSVVVYSKDRLNLNAPGAVEAKLPGEEAGAYRYRYSGLRLLEHTGGSYFLVSDEWSRRYGVVIELPDDNDTLRLEFIRDRR